VSLSALPIFLRLADQPVVLVGTGEAAEAKRRLLERAGARIVDMDAPARIAIVASDSAEADAARLRARGLLVNVVDRPELCDFTLPALVDRNPVLVAIGTAGVSAGLAAALRQRLERLLPQSLGRLAEALHAARPALRSRWPDGGDRRRALGDAFAGPLDPMVEHEPDAVTRWLDGAEAPPPATLLRFRLASADPEELTLRQARALAQADRLFHRADVPAIILDRARADAERLVCDAPPLQRGPGLSVFLEMAA
jgi:uroporphyrin-III C-methyltransferase / precorrin-2 dehydrogenase / sirohydrochlorin ferrochelatase